MSLVNVISAIGNNSSIYPLLVRDCGIENPIKIGMTYSQNLKDSKEMANNAFRERLIDEYGASIVWLGGIPLIDWLCEKGIKKLGYNPEINASLFEETAKQGLEFNIKKFKDKAPKEVEELKKVLANKGKYEKLLAGKFILSTAIPIFLMGYCLPKMNFALTDKIRDKKVAEQDKFEKVQPENKQGENVSFKGMTAAMANMPTVYKMAITDGGLTVGRVGTGRNKFERMEMGFKMCSMMFLNFVAPIYIAKAFDYLSGKLFNTNANLDPKILNDEKFIKAIKENTLKLPQKDIIEFLDKNPTSTFSKLAEQFCGVKYLENGVRDPRAYINEEKIGKFKGEIEKFAQQAKKSGDVEKFAKKALWVKSGNIVANVALSSVLLAVALPKLTFYLRKKITGSDAEPGLVK